MRTYMRAVLAAGTAAVASIGFSGRADAAALGGVDLGNLTNYLLVFTDGSTDANWQGASKGFAGDVAVNGIVAAERTSGTVPFAGTTPPPRSPGYAAKAPTASQPTSTGLVTESIEDIRYR